MKSGAEIDRLIVENLGLVHACANRFRGRGIEYDDLYGAGCIGLVKAANGFDPTRGFAFSTYAVPAILGEIRRLFRDGGTVKVGRAARERARRLLSLRDELSESLGREPTIGEVAEKADMEAAEAALLLSAVLPPLSLTVEHDDGDRQSDIPVESCEQPLLDRLSLLSALDKLCERDRRLIEYRYFHGLTQTVTATKLGMTQVQVSRREKAILSILRKDIAL